MLFFNEIYEGIIIIIILKNDILPVLGLNSGYMAKYIPPSLGVPSGGGLYLTVYHSSCPNTDTVDTTVLTTVCSYNYSPYSYRPH